MYREATDRLIEWQHSPHRKPLILKGARQVGKTWLLKDFGKRNYDNIAYFNFEERPDLKQLFSVNKDVNRIVDELSMFSGEQIQEHKTLVIFDEIQECPDAITTLKYFCENAPNFHIACAGSLIGIALAKPTSYPVGKVNLMDIYPLNFREFLIADRSANLSDYLNNIEEIAPIPDIFFNELASKLKTFLITGGMPEPVIYWTENRDISAVESALNDIIQVYERDFAKHAENYLFPKISLVWQSIPSQLARENKKFLYKLVKDGARAREYEDALQWLIDAGLAFKVFRNTTPRLPISAYDDISAFKIYLADCGILRNLSRLDTSAYTDGSRLFTEFKGALAENFVLQHLVNHYDVVPRYWSQTNPPYEVDFLIQHKNTIVPIEVKSGLNKNSKSLKKYGEIFSDEVKLKVRFSLDNLRLDCNVLNIPLFLVDITDKLVALALESL